MDIIRAMLIVWRIRDKISRAVPGCTVYHNRAHRYAHTVHRDLFYIIAPYKYPYLLTYLLTHT